MHPGDAIHEARNALLAICIMLSDSDSMDVLGLECLLRLVLERIETAERALSGYQKVA